MLLVVSFTAAAGFLSSFLLLGAGLATMWLRYLIAVAIAYVVFLSLIWLWLRTKARDYVDVPDVGSLPDISVTTAPDFVGRGGEFGGGGASASFDGADPTGPLQSIHLPSVGEAVSSAADADEFAIPLLLVVLVGAVIVASLWAAVVLPILLAELLLDGVLAAVLYRRLRRLDTGTWLESAIRATIWPFATVAVLAALSGLAMALAAPGAHTVGEVIRHLKGL